MHKISFCALILLRSGFDVRGDAVERVVNTRFFCVLKSLPRWTPILAPTFQTALNCIAPSIVISAFSASVLFFIASVYFALSIKNASTAWCFLCVCRFCCVICCLSPYRLCVLPCLFRILSASNFVVCAQIMHSISAFCACSTHRLFSAEFLAENRRFARLVPMKSEIHCFLSMQPDFLPKIGLKSGFLGQKRLF